MKYDELQVIWNSQKDAPLFAIDQQAMHELLRTKSSRIESYVEWFELTIIATTILTAIILPIDAYREGGGWHQYIVALLCLVVGMSVCSTRYRRRASQIKFDQSVKSIAERSLRRVENHIRSLKLLFWCFHLPFAICSGIGLTIYSNTRSPLIWTGVILVTVLSGIGTIYDIRVKLNPQRRDVEDLLAKLSEASNN